MWEEANTELQSAPNPESILHSVLLHFFLQIIMLIYAAAFALLSKSPILSSSENSMMRSGVEYFSWNILIYSYRRVHCKGYFGGEAPQVLRLSLHSFSSHVTCFTLVHPYIW
ncbi:hypothetical protein FKM82_004947 [Ascaphus truei]